MAGAVTANPAVVIKHLGDGSDNGGSSFGKITSLNWRGEADKVTAKMKQVEFDFMATQERQQAQKREHQFTVIMCCIVALNICFVGLESEFRTQIDSNGTVADFFHYAELCFFVVFVIEIGIRIMIEGRRWAFAPTNWLDVVCLVPSVLEIAALFYETPREMHVLNLVRFLKVARLVRLAKLAKAFDQVYILVMAWYKAMKGVAVLVGMLMVALFMFAILATELIGQDEKLVDVGLGVGGDRTVEETYGTVHDSMFTLFALITLEGLEPATRPLVQTRPYLFLFYLSFAITFTFGLLNMLVGTVVEKTLSETAKFRHKAISNREVLKISKLEELFSRCDTEGTGTVTREQFERELLTETCASDSLKDIGVPEVDLRDLFNVVDLDGNGELELNEFVTGCMLMFCSPPEELGQLCAHGGVRAIDHRMDVLVNAHQETHALLTSLVSEQVELRKQVESIAQRPSTKVGTEIQTVAVDVEEDGAVKVGERALSQAVNKVVLRERVVEQVGSMEMQGQTLLIEEKLNHHFSLLEAPLQRLASSCSEELQVLCKSVAKFAEQTESLLHQQELHQLRHQEMLRILARLTDGLRALGVRVEDDRKAVGSWQLPLTSLSPTDFRNDFAV